MPMTEQKRYLLAYVLPFGLFMAALGLTSLVQTEAEGAPFFLAEPKYWIYPLQTLLCGAALVWFWKYYDFGSLKKWLTATVVGLIVLVIWVAPQEFLGVQPRLEGFDPNVFADEPLLYWSSLLARFARLVIVVPLLEEIFWRGFLLRWLVKEDFTKLPFGSYSDYSVVVTTVMFGFAHFGPDLYPALLCGILFNWVAIKTKSLACCVWAHAVTNLGLGIYIMVTQQWGFW